METKMSFIRRIEGAVILSVINIFCVNEDLNNKFKLLYINLMIKY